MSGVIYARVPDSLKHALHAHACKRGLSLTQAVVELLEQGLETIAGEQSVTELERKLARSTSEREQTRARLREAELRVQAASEREQAQRAHVRRARRVNAAPARLLPEMSHTPARIGPACQRALPEPELQHGAHLAADAGPASGPRPHRVPRALGGARRARRSGAGHDRCERGLLTGPAKGTHPSWSHPVAFPTNRDSP